VVVGDNLACGLPQVVAKVTSFTTMEDEIRL